MLSNTEPNFIFSIGNDSNKTLLSDFLTFYNNGVIEINTETIINGDTII